MVPNKKGYFINLIVLLYEFNEKNGNREEKNDDSDDYKIIPSSLKDIINPYNCLLKNANFSIKTSNE